MDLYKNFYLQEKSFIQQKLFNFNKVYSKHYQIDIVNTYYEYKKIICESLLKIGEDPTYFLVDSIEVMHFLFI